MSLSKAVSKYGSVWAICFAASILSVSGPAAAESAKPARPAAASEKPGDGAEPSAWAVNCTNQLRSQLTCEMTQRVVDQRTGGEILLLSIKGTSSGDSNALLLRALHGIYLPAGVSIKIDNGTATSIPFQKSDQLGVYAALPLNEKLASEMKRGHELRVTLELNKDQPIPIVARLTGFGPAYEKISTVK